MHNYDFEILQYNEFESLTRDLLQAEKGIYIESFTDGKDGGIDFRYGSVRGKKCIVQVKRYKEWNSLLPQLRKEVAKVERIKPSRYLLSTSVPLTPANKETIKSLFHPYVKDTADIYGRDDLNNLLGKHPHIEQKYYKLWLASTNVLNDILHKDVVNWSRFELDSIREEIRTYVSNDSLLNALRILDKHQYVIISGIPGIGKTTLARMLVYKILADYQYEEFIYMDGGLDTAVQMFQEGKKQVFFFDDFLGANTFIDEKGFESKLLSFIRAIRREKGKLFILTTREYILAQAKEQYEKLKNSNVEIAKCTIDMGTYSPVIRTRILYNHLADAHLPEPYVEALLHGRNYMDLINHPNFNPRVIETYIDNRLWTQDSPEQFVASFIYLFDHPACVWEKAFDALTSIGKYALLVLGTMPDKVYLEDWEKAFRTFCRLSQQDLHLSYTDAEFKRNIHILEDCFVRISSVRSDKLLVELYNPSVRGFLVEYISGFQDVRHYLLAGAHFAEQLYSVFTGIPDRARRGDAYVFLPPEMQELVQNRLREIKNDGLPTCACIGHGRYVWLERDELYVLYRFVLTYPSARPMMDAWITPDDLTDVHSSLEARLYFLKNLTLSQDTRMEVAAMMLAGLTDLREIMECMEVLSDLELENLYTDSTYLSHLKSSIDDKIENELQDLADTQIMMSVLEDMSEYLPSELFPLTDYKIRILDMEDIIKEDLLDEEFIREEAKDACQDDEHVIDEIMTSLRVTD